MRFSFKFLAPARRAASGDRLRVRRLHERRSEGQPASDQRAIEWVDDSGQAPDGSDRHKPGSAPAALRFGIKPPRRDPVHAQNHADHTFGLDEVRRYNAMQQQAIDDVRGRAHARLSQTHLRPYLRERKNINQSFVATPDRLATRVASLLSSTACR